MIADFKAPAQASGHLSKPCCATGGRAAGAQCSGAWHTVGTQELLNAVRLSEEMDEWA